MQEDYFLLQIWTPHGAAMLDHPLPVKSRNSLAHDIINTCAMHATAGLDQDVKDADCQTWNGSAHDHGFRASRDRVFTTFQTLILKRLDYESMEKTAVNLFSTFCQRGHDHGFKTSHNRVFTTFQTLILNRLD